MVAALPQSALLLRGPALPASPQAVARVLHEAGYETEETPTHLHPDKVRHFERARPNQLWQTDLLMVACQRQKGDDQEMVAGHQAICARWR
jgi:hypothetical protein